MRILMVGLDAAGKTTILYKLKLGEGMSDGHSPMFGSLCCMDSGKKKASSSGWNSILPSLLMCLKIHVTDLLCVFSIVSQL
jgi:hypothetical protein